MKKAKFDEEELMVIALFQEKTRQETIDLLKQTLEVLEETTEETSEDEIIMILISAIEKLQQIEDKYYYSLDLHTYLNNLEEEEDEY